MKQKSAVTKFEWFAIGFVLVLLAFLASDAAHATGGGNDGGAGFLGFNWLNKDCWYAALAAEEQSVEVRARLKCGSRAFRNAIAYHVPRRDRQQTCISYMVNTYVEQLTYEREQMEAALAAQATLIMDHTTRETERSTDTLTRVVETCSDCYGEQSK